MPRTPDDPFDAWRKRVESDFPGFFAQFEKEFARMQGMVEHIMEDAMKHAQSPQRGEPFVYGFSMRVGPDGVPNLQPFGSAAPQRGADAFANASNAATDVPNVGLEAGAREPMSDVMEGDEDVSITVELPGVEKQDVSLRVAEDAVTVKAEKGRRYHKQIHLPAQVEPSSAKATFKNGILDVVLRKKGPAADPGQRVDIE